MPIQQLWRDIESLHGLPGDGSIPLDWKPFPSQLEVTKMVIGGIRSDLSKLEQQTMKLTPEEERDPFVGIEASDRRFLLALDKLGAFDRKHAENIGRVLTNAGIEGHKRSKPNQAMLKRLKDASLMNSASGCGCWLTPKGRELVGTLSHSSHD